MVQVTFWDAAVVLIAAGAKPNEVKLGSTVSALAEERGGAEPAGPPEPRRRAHRSSLVLMGEVPRVGFLPL
jgi:hypothetical protein